MSIIFHSVLFFISIKNRKLVEEREGCLIPAKCSESNEHCLRKRKTRPGERPWWYTRLVSVLTDVALCRDKTASHRQYVREKRVGQDDPFECDIVSHCLPTDCGAGLV